MVKKSAHSLRDLTIEEFTTPCVHVLQPDQTIEEAVNIMRKYNIRHLPVLDSHKKILGIVSERDLYSSYKTPENETIPVQKIMKKKPYCVPSQTKIYEVALTMSENKYGSALVLYEDESLGIFTSTDALNALVEFVRGDFE